MCAAIALRDLLPSAMAVNKSRSMAPRSATLRWKACNVSNTMPGDGGWGCGEEDILPVYPHTPHDAPRQRLVTEHFLVAFVKKIIHPKYRREMLGQIVRSTGVYVLVAGIARDSEGKVGVLPLAYEARTGNKRPTLRRDRDGERTGIARPAHQRLADAGVGR